MKLRAMLVTGAALLGCLTMAPSASANHHYMVISEVAGGDNSASAGNEFVELQMLAGGQNVFLLYDAEIRFYDAEGFSTGEFAFSANPMFGQSQRTVLMATTAAATGMNPPPDEVIPDENRIRPAGGAVCFASSAFGGIDCVSWGNFTGAAKLPSEPAANADPNEDSIPLGGSIARTQARGCATLMEFADDTNDSAADFSPSATLTPRPNSVTPTEHACTTGGGGPTPGSCGGKTATKTGTNGAEVIVGTAGKDVVAALGGNDTVRGLAGNDLLCGGGGRDTLVGGGGRDRLLGQAGRDTCKGGPKRDVARTCEVKRTI